MDQGGTGVSRTQAVADEIAPPLPAARAGRTPWWRWAVTLALCVLTWSWLARQAQFDTLAAQIGAVPAWVWLAAAGAQLAGYALRGWRVRREWRDAGAVRWLACVRLVLLHNAAVLVLPLRSGEAGYVWLLHKQWRVGVRAAAVSLLRWRIQDAAVLAAMAIALLPAAGWPVRLLLLAAAVLVMALVLPRIWSWLARRHLPQRAEAAALWRGCEVTAAQWSCKLLGAALVLSQLVQVPWYLAFQAALGGELASAQPFQPPASLGVYEGGVWIAGGAPHGSALVSAALAFHAFSLCVALGAAALAQLFVPAAPEGGA
jgi:hypothetical protein